MMGVAGVALLARPPAKPARGEQGPLLPRVQFLHALGASQQVLLADYFWLGTLQQIGIAMGADGYRDIFPYADLATDLDPQFKIVYRTAAVSLPFNYGRETWVNGELSTRLLRKGLRTFPGDFQFQFLLANNLMFLDHRYAEAADVVRDLSRQPSAPPYLSGLATRLYAQSGDFGAGVALAAALRDAAPDDETRAYFEHRILEIREEQVLQTIDAASTRFKSERGHVPSTVLELVSGGYLAAIPIDPLGGTLGFNRVGEAISSTSDKRLRLHQLNHEVNDSKP